MLCSIRKTRCTCSGSSGAAKRDICLFKCVPSRCGECLGEIKRRIKGSLHWPRRHVNDDCRCNAIIISDGIGGCRTCCSESIAGGIFHAAQCHPNDNCACRRGCYPCRVNVVRRIRDAQIARCRCPCATESNVGKFKGIWTACGECLREVKRCVKRCSHRPGRHVNDNRRCRAIIRHSNRRGGTGANDCIS